MNLYYSMIGRLLDGRTSIRNEGYYIMDDQNEVVFSKKAPIYTEIVTIERFTDALAEGCRHVLRSFAETSDNKQVYAFSLCADEYSSIYVYMNTISCFEKTLEKYQSKNADYKKQDRIQSLKYNCGDFDFQFWQDHMGQNGRYVSLFESIAYRSEDVDKGEFEQAIAGTAVVAFEAGIIENGYYVCALEAMQRLVDEGAFDILNKADDFIAYTFTRNDYLDYGLVMRKTIERDLFYRVFPDIQKSDEQFNEEMNRNRQLSVIDSIAYWSDAIHSDYSLEPPFTYVKPAMEVFVQLEHFGNELAKECLERLTALASLNSFDRKDYERLGFYIEALYFCGPLTSEQTKQCIEIGLKLTEAGDILIEYAKELEAIAS
ncbi:DUF4303 domain-containing protein [Paenibacillus sp. 1011MAR3C5]|uniref:DUF4303 domain-containing protein n=1 Tax=Paenibacillus sp. 1011MAR3C5 TaxID=1675787 RepID=UPI0015FF6D17|nr:DUF4303 domain-containing protein [Paenibacillus sp. 1011MAR3C5]